MSSFGSSIDPPEADVSLANSLSAPVALSSQFQLMPAVAHMPVAWVAAQQAAQAFSEDRVRGKLANPANDSDRGR